MKIGIIVHSMTGNTYSVAERLKDRLLTAGHTVNIEKVIPSDEKQMDVKSIQLKTVPDISPYDALVFGAPVRGFSLSPAMAAYLGQLASLNNKKVACMTTEFFPFPWMGGNRAISQMMKICKAKGAAVCGTGVVNWKNVRRNKMITDLVEKFSILFC